jgi:uncharacterized protein (DUF1778 family)
MREMSVNGEARGKTWNLRVQPSQSELIDRAASIKGQTRTEFILETACEEAKKVITNQTFFALSEEKYQEFINILDAPPQPVEGLRKLFATKAPWEKVNGGNRN